MTGCDEDWRVRLTGPPGMVAGPTAAASACSSGPGSSPAPQAASATGASSSAASSSPTAAVPAGTETPPPGDIPDSTVYVAYRAGPGQYEVKVPEGWARTASPAGVSFT